MSVDISVSIPNLAEMVGRLKAFRNDQLPYALSVAMNRAAKDGRDGVRGHLRSQFDLQSDTLHLTFGPFGGMPSTRAKAAATSAEAAIAQGIARGWSHRSQWPQLRVVLGSRAFAAGLQEEGGVKPFSGTKDGVAGGRATGTKPSKQTASRAWIPTKYLPREGSRIARNFQPSRIKPRLLARRRGTRATDTVWQAGKYIMRREDGARSARPIYILTKRAVVPPRLELEQYVVKTYQAKLWPRFSQAMAAALATAKNGNRFTPR